MEEYEIIGKPLPRIDGVEKAAGQAKFTVDRPCPECFTIANAVYDAIGIRFTRLPITPENVLEALWKR